MNLSIVLERIDCNNICGKSNDAAATRDAAITNATTSNATTTNVISSGL